MSRLRKYLQNTPLNHQKEEAIATLASLDVIEKNNPKIAASIIQELKDQRTNLKLIASENYCSPEVQLSMGNWLTDKYAEGFPHHRFYAGCENVDQIEELAVQELKNLFGAEHAFVQPHSGADANLVAFWSILVHRIQTPEVERLGKKNINALTDAEYETVRQLLVNQKMMGMSLNSGGHLTHGYRHNFSSKMMKAVYYEVDRKTEQLDYQALKEQVKQEKPTIFLAGFSAYSRKLNFAKLKEIADSVGATFMVDMAHFAGLVAGKVFTGEYNPVPYADIITSTTHKTLRGPRGGMVLCKQEYAEVVDRACPLVLGGPLPHVMAAKAIAFKEANTESFRTYSQQIVKNAQALAQGLMKRGCRIVTGGTENHLLIIDLTSWGVTGKQVESALKNSAITCNRNTIPFDPTNPWHTSGIRLGTPALTTLGMKEPEMDEVADLIVQVIKHTKPAMDEKGEGQSKTAFVIDPAVVLQVRQRVLDLLTQFPLYPHLPLEL